MPLPDRADVIVIGGGIAGCSVAYHLADLHAGSVLLLEQNELGAGTTWHAAGAVGRMRISASLARLNDRSARMYARMEQESGLPTGWRVTGSYTVARAHDRMVQLRRAGAIASHFGVVVDEVGPAAVAEHWPLARLDDVIGAVWLPDDGVVDPLLLTRAIAAAAARKGVSIAEHTPVEGLLVRDREIRGVRTAERDVEAGAVVLCAGMWTRQLAQGAGIAVAIQPVEHHYVLSRPLDPALDRLPVVRDPDGHIYFRGRGDQLMLGAFQPVSKPWLVDRVPADFAFRLLDPDWEHFAPPLAEARRRLPALESHGIQEFVNGPEGFTPDGNPLAGEVPGVRGLFICAGFNSSGLAYGGGVGETVAQWMLEGEPPFDTSAIDVRRFCADQAGTDFLRARGVEVLGTHMRLAYPNMEWRRGRDLRRSPLHERLAAQGACFGEKLGVERANWFSRNGSSPEVRYSFDRPSWFDDSRAEHLAARSQVVVFDVSSFGKLRVSGAGALATLQRACANDVDVGVGRVVYTAMLSARGTFASDLTVLRTGEREFLVITGTAQRVADRAWLERHAGQGEADARIADVSDDFAVLAVMGPGARELLAGITDADLSLAAFPFGTSQRIVIGGVPCLAVRITYVGELGWELHVARERAVHLYDAVRRAADADAALGAGYYAINSLRLEKGYRQWGTDVTLNDTPLEAGLAFAVAWDKPVPFHGRDALLRRREEGRPPRRLVSLVLGDPEPILWGGELILREGRPVGYTTSGAYGHTIGAAVGLGYVTLDDAPVTEERLTEAGFEIDVAGRRVGAIASLRAPYDADRSRVLR
jgi:4-methylaminobutanoate oxidase (formaldehyde-forming)